MIGRVLRIELRRSTARWFAAIMVMFGVVFLYYLGVGQTASWMTLADGQRLLLTLLWPLALGAGAWQARRDRRSGMEELIRTTARPRWRRALPVAAALAVGAIVGYLGMVAAGTPLVLPTASYFPTGAVSVVAVGVLSMIAAVWLGLAIGALRPSALTPPVLGAISAAALVAAGGYANNQSEHMPGTLLFLPNVLGLDHYLTTEFIVGHVPEFSAVTARAHLSQVVWFVAVAATGLAAFAAATRRGRILALVPAVLGAAIALPLQPHRLSGAITYDQAAIAPVCTPDAPRVCVTQVHAHLLEDLREPARQALAILSTKLPNAPTSVAEFFTHLSTPNPQPRRADTVMVVLRVQGGRNAASPEEIQYQLLDGAGTPPCTTMATAPERYRLARDLAAAWLLDTPPPPDADSQALRNWTTLQSLPVQEQRARVAAFREAELACDGRDRLDILIGPNGSR